MIDNYKVGVILLAGGQGTRFNHPIPKQFIKIKDKPIAKYSYDLFMKCPEIDEIIVVCHPDYRNLFEKTSPNLNLNFALPGPRRQDSVWNGLQAFTQGIDLVCIHDSARPFITSSLIHGVLQAGYEHGAATLGMPIKFTLKEHNGNAFVSKTPDRSLLWEIQTPQVVRKDVLKKGFQIVQARDLTVTDDVSIAELVNSPVKLVQGSYFNIKITTSEDLDIADYFIKKYDFS